MLYSGNLLKKYINIEDDIETLSKHLTLKTCEIEEYHIRKIPEDVVIGKCISVEKHPDADSLFVCKVDCGKHGIFQIITGGENIAESKYVATALPGCFLPAINMKIDARKMRGVDSCGMICSKGELGIKEDEEKHWIWLMEEDLSDLSDEDLGISLGKRYPWMENYILDVDNKTLTNRPDLTGHFGISVELNGIYRNEKSKIKFNSINKYMKTFADGKIIEILDRSSKSNIKIECLTSKVNSYTLIEIKNVNIKPSTFFTRTLMLDSNCQPRNNWVDFSNLFMLISGQPVHFFDADKIDGNIIVRTAVEGEIFVDLFDKEHTLNNQDIVIADKNKILALGGVVGGKDSGVSEETKNIIVEIANFDPVSVRKTGTRLGLRTDAELRFEKNINPIHSLQSLILFLDELKYFNKDLGEFDMIGLDYYVNPQTQKSANNKKLLGIDYEKLSKFILGESKQDFIKEGKEILESIGFIEKQDGKIYIPSWRSEDDINTFADICEEVTRIYGYEKIQNKTSISEINFPKQSETVELTRLIEQNLVFLGYNQIETYPWLDDEGMEFLHIEKKDLLKLLNPLSPEAAHLRSEINYGVLKMVKKNSKFFDKINVFEIGKIWEKISHNEFKEKTNIIFTIYNKNVSEWHEDCYLKGKTTLETLLNKIGIRGKIEYKLSNEMNHHPKKQGIISLNGKHIGKIFTLHPICNENFKLPEKSQTTVVEISFDLIKELYISQKKGIYNSKYETLQDQIIIRDLSFVIDRNESFGKIAQAIKNIKEIESFETFDIYGGDKLPENKKSISISIKIKGSGNMTSENINEIMNKAIKAVNEIGGELRA